MHVEVEGENGFFPPIASNSCILHAIVESKEEEEELAPFWYSPLPQSTYAKHIEKTTVSRTGGSNHDDPELCILFINVKSGFKISFCFI